MRVPNNQITKQPGNLGTQGCELDSVQLPEHTAEVLLFPTEFDALLCVFILPLPPRVLVSSSPQHG